LEKVVTLVTFNTDVGYSRFYSSRYQHPPATNYDIEYTP